MRKKGLGKGLDVLLGADSPEGSSESLKELGIDFLKPGQYQPRSYMEPEALETLANSIKQQGLLQPITVRQIGDGQYEIIAGERRWQAAKKAGLSMVAVRVLDIPDEKALIVSLIENIQREDLNAIEEASGIERLITEFGLTHQQAADAVGRSRSAASNLLRLLQLSEPVQTMLKQGQIEMGHARTLVGLDEEQQIKLAKQFFEQGGTVREAEQLVSEISQSRAASKKKKELVFKDKNMIHLQDSLSDYLGAVVVISVNKKGKGNMSFKFNSLDQLDGLLDKLGYEEIL